MKRLLFLPLVSLVSCGFIALPLEKVANTSRTDSQAADGKGGWLDLGSHDARLLPAGEAKYAGVPFVVPPSGDETAKNCLILGRDGAEKATLTLEHGSVGHPRLYLLHAVADGPAPEMQKQIGKIVLRYEDGSSDERTVCVGRDVTDWTSGRSFSNSARAWTDYNFNTQVSLFASQFKLDAGKKLTAVEFASNGKCPWMIEAVSVAGKRTLRPLRSSVEIFGAYASPKPPPADLARFPSGRRPKNVILVIGDGMGQGAARLASSYKYGCADGAYFQQLPVVGLCATSSANNPVTDSAAAATAFATGTKTSNGVLGLQVDAQHDRAHAVRLVSVAERAQAKGLAVAILTSDALFGATPGAFFAHTMSRGEPQQISAQAADCGYEVLIGSSRTEPWFRPEEKGGKRKDGRDLVAEMEKKGYALVRTTEELSAVRPSAKVLGSLSSFGEETSIAEAMTAVLKRFADRSEGFFMMAECADTDHACHSNDSSYTVKAVSMVEFMAQAAIDFARTRDDTLVVVTADHDTGHPSVIRAPGPNGRLLVEWSDTSHTKFPVPVHAYGPGAELFEGLFDNTDIAKSVSRLLLL